MHLLSDLRSTQAEALTDVVGVSCSIAGILQRHDVQQLGEVLHQFDTGGYTLAFILAESHLALHTWPESGFVTLDVYLCNFSRDNSDRSLAIHDEVCALFAPSSISTTKVDRL